MRTQCLCVVDEEAKIKVDPNVAMKVGSASRERKFYGVDRRYAPRSKIELGVTCHAVARSCFVSLYNQRLDPLGPHFHRNVRVQCKANESHIDLFQSRRADFGEIFLDGRAAGSVITWSISTKCAQCNGVSDEPSKL